MNSAVRFAGLFVLCGLVAACGEKTTPTAPVEVTSAPLEPGQRFPGLTKPARVYVAIDCPAAPDTYCPFRQGYPRHGWQRLVLYEDGTVVLVFNGFVGLIGVYRQTGSAVEINVVYGEVGQGGGIGSLAGDLLTVDYSDFLNHSDFYDTLYRLER